MFSYAIYAAIAVLQLNVCMSPLSEAAAVTSTYKNLQYLAKVESNVLDKERINSVVIFSVHPVIVRDDDVRNQHWYQLQLHQVEHDIATHYEPVKYPKDMLDYVVYFSTSPTGLINRLYYNKQDDSDLVHLKKYMVSVLSAQLQDGEGDDWEYKALEIDHAGEGHHHYRARRTTEGKEYTRRKQVLTEIPHEHKKVMKVNSNGVLTDISSHESMVLLTAKDAESSQGRNGNKKTVGGGQNIENKIEIKLMNYNSVKQPRQVQDSELNELVNGTVLLELHDEENRKYTLKEAQLILKKGFKCTTQNQTGSSKRGECVMQMRKAIARLSPSDLIKLGNMFFRTGCKARDNKHCHHDRHLMIDILARIGSLTSQNLLLKHVMKDKDEVEIQRLLFHFSVLEHPTSKSVETVAEICFGKNMEHHGVLRMSGNQKRACLTLGSMLKRHSNIDPNRSHQLLDHLHTWLLTDQDIEPVYDSGILRDYKNHEENSERLQFIHSKSVLLHSLGNAAQPQSRDFIAAYAQPNSGHGDTRHTAMKALRHYTCKESSTLLLNASLNDEDMAVKSTAYGIYKDHPRAGELSHTDENLLLSKSASSEKHLREKRSTVCNLIEKLTIDFKLEIPGFDWSKHVGNDFIGASFGARFVNYGNVHMSPVAMFFEIQINNSAWINSWVKVFKRHTFDILSADICFARAYRMYNISNMLDYNMRDILSKFEAFNTLHTEIVEPMMESVNEYYQLLGKWTDTVGNIELGCGRKYAKQLVVDGKDQIKERANDLKQAGKDWIEDKFGSVIDFIDKVKGFKADVINKKNEIKDTFKGWKEDTIDNIRGLYEESLAIVQEYINDFTEEFGMSFELEILDECVGTVNIIDLLTQPRQAGKEIVDCLEDSLKDRVETDVGLMGQMNRLLRNVRQLQDRFYNITSKVENLKHAVENTRGGAWHGMVQRLVERTQGFIDDMATGMLDFVNGNLDDMGMNMQYVVTEMDQAVKFLDNALGVVKEAPIGAIIDIDRATRKINVAQILYDSLREKFVEKGSELQGKVSSWMEGGVDHENLVRSLEQVLDHLNDIKQQVNVTLQGNIRSVSSPKEKLEKIVQEVVSIDTILSLLWDIADDLKSIRYLADGYKDSFIQVNNGMIRSGESFEALKRGADAAKSLVQKIFGIKFHPLFPKQVKTECDDNCGGCGIYPNVMNGRTGAQFLAHIGQPIVAPLDAKVVNYNGSENEVIIYPLSSDMSDYEIVISFIIPAAEVLNQTEGLFVDAGTVIGEAIASPCQPNFIHVAVRKFNSTANPDPPAEYGILPRQQNTDDSCGSTPDVGEYVPVEDYSESEDPNPNYLEGCSKAEFTHIKELFDIEVLAEKYEEFKSHVQEVVDDVTDYINKTVTSLEEFPVVKVEDMEAMKEQVVGACKSFTNDIFEIVTQPRQKVKYGYDEFGNRVKNMSFSLPPNIPVITDFINTMNFTVEEFGDFLLEAGLDDLYEKLMTAAEDMALTLDSSMCEMLNKVKPPKLRFEVLKESGKLEGTKDFLKAQLQQLKIKGCQNFLDALKKGENHLCEVEDTSDCQSIQCVTSNKFDNKVLELSVGLAFDPCTISIQVRIKDKEITVEYSGGDKITLIVPVTHVDHVNISAHINVEFTSTQAIVDISLHACHLDLPVCFGSTPIFKDLKFDINLNRAGKSCIKLNSDSGSGSGSSQTFQSRYITETLKKVKAWKMDEFLYSMDRFNISRKEVNNIVETTRTSVLTQLSSLSSLRSSIVGKEIFQLPDLGSGDVIMKGPFDIEFYSMTFGMALLSITVSAGGQIDIGFDLALMVLNSNISVTPKATIASYAEANGKASLVVTAVGLKLRGTLMETIFYLTVDIKWPEYPITIDFKMGVNLIPLGVDFKGFFKILFVEIDFRIFSWKAPMIEGPAYTNTFLIHDKTAPEYEWTNSTCSVEQVVGRHWSDPAFYIEAPFYDPQSVLLIQYSVGTYQDGTDVQAWQDMGGVSQIVPVQLKITGVPLHFTVRASNTCNLTSVVHCVLDTYDVTPATGRFEASHIYTSHPSKIAGTLIVIEDSPLTEEQYTGVGLGYGYVGDQVVEWHLFNFQRDVVNKDGEGALSNFSPPRQGRLTCEPIKSLNTKLDTDCATECINMGDSCASFDYDYGSSKCDLLWTIEGKAAELVPSGAYHNFEKLGAGYTAYFAYNTLNLIHGETYYLNSRITNIKGYESYIYSHGIIFDSTPPEPGPIGKAKSDTMRHDNCSAAITQGERCIEVTPNNNHRFIIDGDGAGTVFNGNFPKSDQLYTISNHYMTANWDGFHDDETDIWGYTWAVGTDVCKDDIQKWDDPHSHLADKSYWTHQGLSSDLALADGRYYVSVQALNSIIYGGALVTTVCHSIPITVDTSPPWLDYVEDVYYDEDFDILAIYYKASDPESGIKNTDIGLGETKHDVFIRPYSRHDPLHDGYEMISVDGVDLPAGVPVWVRVRVVNNVDMLTADHASSPLMMDPTPPVIGSILDGNEHLVDLTYQSYNNKMCVQWYDWYDPESGIDKFLWGIGSNENITDIRDFGIEYDHYTTSACMDIELKHGATYYNIIQAYNKAVNSRPSQMSSAGITVDITEPIAGWVKDGSDPNKDIMYSSHAASIYANWDNFSDEESGINEYTVSVSVNEEIQKVFVMDSNEQMLEDHTLHFRQSDKVQVEVEAQNGAKLTNMSQSSGFVVDLTPPNIKFLKDHPLGLKYQVNSTAIYAHWLFEDDESNIKEYRFRLIEQKGKSKFHLWPSSDEGYEIITPNGTTNEIERTITGLNMKNGLKYIVEVTAMNNAKLANKQESRGVMLDTSPPEMSKIYIGSFGAIENVNDDNEIIHEDHYGIQASWVGYDHESGIRHFMVAVGVDPGDDSITGGYRSFGRATDGYIDNIQLNVTAETGILYYVSIYAINGAGENCSVTSSKAIHVYGENTPGIIYDGRDAFVDADYTTDTVTVSMSFQGFESPACGIRSYEWALGSKPGFSDLLSYTGYGIVMINESHGIAEIHLQLKHNDVLYASVRAHTGNSCSEPVIYSCSNGLTVDIEQPEVEFVTIGVKENDTAHESLDNLYQEEYKSIALEWNSTDETSGLLNDTWMAGSLPLTDDKYIATESDDTQIPIGTVSMSPGETAMFTVIATDLAGNVREAVSPPLTIDITGPIVEGFRCSNYLSIIKSEVECKWDLIQDDESPIVHQQISVGSKQMEDNILPQRVVSYGYYSWKHSLHDFINDDRSNKIVITLEVFNKAMLRTFMFSEVTIDRTLPIVSDSYISTPVRPDEVRQPKMCQQSTTTIEVSWEEFIDTESGINSYEVAVGTHMGYSDISPYMNVGKVTSVFLDQLNLPPGTQVYSSVRAVNNARLVSDASTSSVHISPNPKVEVWDGLGDKDIDFQNDLSTITGQVKLSQHCPIIEATWTAYDILGNVTVNETQFFKDRFANDELELENFKTYYVVVELLDGINRTLRAKSDGVMMVIQPPRPGEVRDGLYYGEDRNYQESTTELSVNWDHFGEDEDDPLQNIVRYEVAIGDNTAFPETRTNIHYFVDVGLNLNYTFYNLRLTPKTVHYYATVKGYSESGASVTSVSNGIKVGYSEGMYAGEVYVTEFTNNATSINFYWDLFRSDFTIVQYKWGIGETSFADDNVTLPCHDLLTQLNKWASSVQPLIDEKQDTYAEKHDLVLQHGTEYYVIVVAEDQAGQCITSISKSFFVDLTPPTKGTIMADGISQSIQYTTNQHLLKVEWVGYDDKESGIKDFFIQLKRESDCLGSSPDEWISLSKQLDVKDTTKHTFMGLNLQINIPYRIVMTIANNAGGETADWSDPIFVDATEPVVGIVKDGLDWTQTRHYQSSQTKLEAIFAVSPNGSTLECPLIQSIMKETDVTWNIVNDYSIVHEGRFFDTPHIDYKERNVLLNDDLDTQILFHYNISTSHLEGGAVVSESIEMMDGEYTITMQASSGDQVVFSVTLSNGWMDEYTDFDLPNVEDPVSDEDFLNQAVNPQIDFDKELDVSPATIDTPSTEAIQGTTKMLTQIPLNVTEVNKRDNFDTSAVGFHIMGFPFGNNTKQWMAFFWARDIDGIKSNWIHLDHDPTKFAAAYKFYVAQDLTEANAGWNVYFYVNDTQKGEMNGVNLPKNYTITMRHWTYNKYEPPFDDPFHPFKTEARIKNFTIPLPKERPCQFGSAFYDMESGIKEIYVGVSNTSEREDNVVGYHLAYDLCHSCELSCDHYRCNSSCNPILDDGYQILKIHLDNLTLSEGDVETESEVQQRWKMFPDVMNNELESSNDTAFMPNRYYILLKVINEAGIYTITSSPGIKIDTSPPLLERIEATDPDYDPLAPSNYQSSNNTLSAWWTFEEKESFITDYRIAIGTNKNDSDIMDYFSVGTSTSIRLDLEDGLVAEETYYISVEVTNAAGLKTFASTNGITVLTIPPDTSNSTFYPVNSTEWPTRNSKQHIYLTEYQDRFGIIVDEALEKNVKKLMWCIGESPSDTFISACIEIEKKYYGWDKLELMDDGYFWFNGIQSDIHLTWLAQKSGQINMTLDEEYVDPGRLWLEVGQCVYHHLYAQNVAHLTALVGHQLVCIKKSSDKITSAVGGFKVDIEEGENKATVTGRGQRGAVIVGAMDRNESMEDYGTSANTTYKPYIVDPEKTMYLTSRVMTNRLKRYTNRSITLSPADSAILSESFQIEMSFSGIQLETENESLALLFWDRGTNMWYNVDESSNNNSVVDNHTQIITGWFAGPVSQHKSNDHITDASFEYTEPYMIGLFVISFFQHNSEPVLLTKRLTTKANTNIQLQLNYHDIEDDKVKFKLASNGQNGKASLDETGLFTYSPDSYFYGMDEIVVTLQEVEVPLGVEAHVIEESIHIRIIETPFAPYIFMLLDEGLDEGVNTTGARLKISSDDVLVKHEGNTTLKPLGKFFICDFNPDNKLELLLQSSDEVNVTKSEVTSDQLAILSKQAQNINDSNIAQSVAQCIDKNIKVFSIAMTTSEEYHGEEKLVFIGKDSQMLFSQPLTVDVYTLVSPCGQYGQCTSQHDPYCQSTDRASTFESYECQCDKHYSGTYCDMNTQHTLQFTLAVVCMCTFSLIFLLGLVTAYKSHKTNRISPLTSERKHKRNQVSPLVLLELATIKQESEDEDTESHLYDTDMEDDDEGDGGDSGDDDDNDQETESSPNAESDLENEVYDDEQETESDPNAESDADNEVYDEKDEETESDRNADSDVESKEYCDDNQASAEQAVKIPESYTPELDASETPGAS